MTTLERRAARIRHSQHLRGFGPLWNALRPIYNGTIRTLAPNGISRSINGTDDIRISPRLRNMPDEYEPDVWRRLMGELRPGDLFVDVGAYIGLYACAAANRAGPNGAVVAFEPDAANYAILKANQRVNGLATRLSAENKAVGATEGATAFRSGRGSESRLTPAEIDAAKVAVVTLDAYFADRRVDILKIDVEGYEEAVLRGAHRLLTAARKPRAIFIEVHPFAWHETGATSQESWTCCETAITTSSGLTAPWCVSWITTAKSLRVMFNSAFESR
jgi:FkbM family methyltransferase